MVDAMVVVCTASSADEAKQIARALVDNRLAGCVNIIPNVTSIYRWQGNVCSDQEVTLVIKSKQHLLDRVIEAIKTLHSYSVPEIIAIPIIGGSQEYLDWLDSETGNYGK